MTIQDSDLMILQQGTTPYKVTTAGLKNFFNSGFAPDSLPIATTSTIGAVMVGDNLTIDPLTGKLDAVIPSGVNFKHAIPATDDAPGSPAPGDMYIFTTSGTLNATWGNQNGTAVNADDAIIYSPDGEWDIIPGLFKAGVTSVRVSDPLSVDNTDPASPVISIADAAPSVSGVGGQKGVMSATDKEKLDNINPGADIGTVTEVTASAPLAVSNGTTTPQLSITTASATDTGVVKLADATDLTNGSTTAVVTASQHKALRDDFETFSQATPAVSVTSAGLPIEVDNPSDGNFTVGVLTATDARTGVVQLATQAEVSAGTVDTKAITPASAKGTLMPFDITQLGNLP